MIAEIGQRFPHIVTEIINLDDPASVRPGNVIAVPTYTLNEKVFSLGNPRREEMFAMLTSSFSQVSTGER
jgi:hypothetical protein